jgi:hypothetical protein
MKHLKKYNESNVLNLSDSKLRKLFIEEVKTIFFVEFEVDIETYRNWNYPHNNISDSIDINITIPHKQLVNATGLNVEEFIDYVEWSKESYDGLAEINVGLLRLMDAYSINDINVSYFDSLSSVRIRVS